MWETTRVRSLGREDPLEKEMAPHSSALVWKIPWTEKPGRLQSMGSQRVGHNWATSLSLSITSLAKEFKEFPSCVFSILLLHGPWYQMKLSAHWNQTDETGAGYSAIFLGLWVAHQIWGWSLHTYLACLLGSQRFSQPWDYRWFQIHHGNLASSS